MALLNRFSKLNDRAETGIFTFIVTPSVTRDLHRDATTKDFCFGYHRWAVSFQRPTDKLLGVHLLLRNASPSTACVVDFTLTLLNREHFSQNQVYTKRQAKFTITNPMQGVSRWIELSELVERRFSNESGEFLFELSLSNMTTIFECDVQLSAQVLAQYKQLLKSAGQPAAGASRSASAAEQPSSGHKSGKSSKNSAASLSNAASEQPINLVTNQFTFGSFDWSLTIVPLVMPASSSGSAANDPQARQANPTAAAAAAPSTNNNVQQQQPPEAVCRIYLNRLSGFDSLCRVKYRVILGHHQPGGAHQSAEWVDSKQLDQISDCGGRIRGFQFRSTNILKLVSLRHNVASSQATASSLQQQQQHHHNKHGSIQQMSQGGSGGAGLDLRVHIEMLCANTISEARVPIDRRPADELQQVANCSDRNKQAWRVEADTQTGDTLKLKLFFLDLQSVPRNHIRYISWIAYLVRRDHKSGQMRDSLAVRNAPHSNYYLQDGIDMGSIMESELGVKELNKSATSYLEAGQLTVHIEWVDSLLLFSHLYNNYDALATVQRHQISRELEALQQEFDHLEGKYLQTQRSLSRLVSQPPPPLASCERNREHSRQKEQQSSQQQQLTRKRMSEPEGNETTPECSDTSDSESRRARRFQSWLQNGRSSGNSDQLQLHQKPAHPSARPARHPTAAASRIGGLASGSSSAASSARHQQQQQLASQMQPASDFEARSSSSLSLGELLPSRRQLASRSGSMRAQSPMSSVQQAAEWLRRSSGASSLNDAQVHLRDQPQVISQTGADATTSNAVVRRRLPQPKVAAMAPTSSLEHQQLRHLAPLQFDPQQQPRQLSVGYNYQRTTGQQEAEQEQQRGWPPGGLATNGNGDETRRLSPDEQLDERLDAANKLDRLQMIALEAAHQHQHQHQEQHHQRKAGLNMAPFSAGGQASISGAAAYGPAGELEAGESALGALAAERADLDKNFQHLLAAARNDRLLDAEQSGVQLDHQHQRQRQLALQLHAGHHQDQQQFASTRASAAATPNYRSVSIGHYAPTSETAPVYLAGVGQPGPEVDKSIDDIPLELLSATKRRNGAGSHDCQASFQAPKEPFAISASMLHSGELSDGSIASHYLERARSIRRHSPASTAAVAFVPSSSPLNVTQSNLIIDQLQQRRHSPATIESKWSHLTAAGEPSGLDTRRKATANDDEQERRRLSELAIDCADDPITGLDEELASIELEARFKYL